MRHSNPQTVEQLIKLVHAKYGYSEKLVLERITSLQEARQIRFTQHRMPSQTSLSIYLRSAQAAWYWITLAITAASVAVVLTVSSEITPLIYMRYVLGAILVLWLPGYTLTRALFPHKTPNKSDGKELDTLERIALSIGLSIAIVPIVGLLLNYTSYGITLGPILLSLAFVTLVFATAALLREHSSTRATDWSRLMNLPTS